MTEGFTGSGCREGRGAPPARDLSEREVSTDAIAPF